MTCTIILLQCVSVLLPDSIQLLMASKNSDFLLAVVVYAFFNEVKNYRGDPDKILVTWDISLYSVSQEVPAASLFLSLKDPVHDPWVGWLSSSPRWWGGGGCGKGAGCMAGGGPGFR